MGVDVVADETTERCVPIGAISSGGFTFFDFLPLLDFSRATRLDTSSSLWLVSSSAATAATNLLLQLLFTNAAPCSFSLSRGFGGVCLRSNSIGRSNFTPYSFIIRNDVTFLSNKAMRYSGRMFL